MNRWIRVTIDAPDQVEVQGYDTMKHCLTALVMATEEVYGKKMASSVGWVLLHLLNELLENMPEEHAARWGRLSQLSMEELRRRWEDVRWPQRYRTDFVDKPGDTDEPPF
jgi:hypothetical protein